MTNQELKELVAALAVAHTKTSTRLDATTKLLTDYIAGQEASRARALLALGQSDYAFEASGAQVHAPLTQTVAAGDSVGNGLVVDLSVSPSKAAVAKAFFFSSLSANPVLDGILFNRVEFAEQIRFNHKQAEFDIVMVNGKSVAVIEVKYKVHEKDIEQVEKSLKAKLQRKMH